MVSNRENILIRSFQLMFASNFFRCLCFLMFVHLSTIIFINFFIELGLERSDAKYLLIGAFLYFLIGNCFAISCITDLMMRKYRTIDAAGFNLVQILRVPSLFIAITTFFIISFIYACGISFSFVPLLKIAEQSTILLYAIRLFVAFAFTCIWAPLLTFIPAIIHQKLGPFACFHYSRKISKGYFSEVFFSYIFHIIIVLPVTLEIFDRTIKTLAFPTKKVLFTFQGFMYLLGSVPMMIGLISFLALSVIVYYDLSPEEDRNTGWHRL